MSDDKALQSPSQPVVGEAANAWRYDPPPAFPRSAVPIIRIYRDKHLAEDGWAETPLYAHPQASPPPVQTRPVEVTGIDIWDGPADGPHEQRLRDQRGFTPSHTEVPPVQTDTQEQQP